MNTTFPRSLTQAERLSIISGVVLTIYLSSLAQSIIGPALPTIGYELHDITYLPWVVTAYLVAATTVTPIYGRLSDMHGRRPMLYIAVTIYVLGSVISALAPSVLALVIGRAVQGLGGGGLVSLSQAVIGDNFPPRDRGVYQGYLSTAFTGANISGPIIGGALAQFADWTLIFWLNVPLGLIAVTLVHRSLKSMPIRRGAHRLDARGAMLLALSTVSIMLALSSGGARYPWTSLPMLVLFSLAVLSGIFFIVHTLHSEDPLMPLDVLRDRVVAPVAFASFFSMFTTIGITIYIPVYFQVVTGLSPGATGVALIVPVLGSLAGSMGMGKIMGRLERPKNFAAFALIVGSTSLMILALALDQLSFFVVELLLAGATFAVGVMYPTGTVSTQNAVARHHLGVGLSTLNFIRSIGAATGGAVFGVLVLGSGNPAILDLLNHGKVSLVAADSGVSAVFQTMFGVAALAKLLSLAGVLAMEHRPLRATL
jgi:MFS family permease